MAFNRLDVFSIEDILACYELMGTPPSWQVKEALNMQIFLLNLRQPDPECGSH